MYGTFEVIAWKHGNKTIKYYTYTLYNGIANDIRDKMVAAGYTDINIRLI